VNFYQILNKPNFYNAKRSEISGKEEDGEEENSRNLNSFFNRRNSLSTPSLNQPEKLKLINKENNIIPLC
jgi:hypothetical protein